MTGRQTPSRERPQAYDLAIIGAGVAGTSIAAAIVAARPDWSVALIERSRRIGGRVWSKSVPGVEHPIELGGMRYLTSHRRVVAAMSALGLESRPFDVIHGPERSFLRGHLGSGPTDPSAGEGYDLPEGERHRSAVDLTLEAFRTIVSGADRLDEAGWTRIRAGHRYRDRAVTEWSIGDAIAAVRSPEGHRFMSDSFGYDSGFRPFNAGDAIQYLLGGGDPTAEARVPIGGMDEIPKALVQRFEEAGGTVLLGHELERLEVDGDGVLLRFAGDTLRARRVVLTMPVPALSALSDASPVIASPVWRRLLASVEGFPATKLYAWYRRPWWRGVVGGIEGIRTTTDLPNRKVFYFDSRPDAPAAIIGAYTDGRHVVPWVELANGVSNGGPAPSGMLEALKASLAAFHPEVARIPEPVGTAFMHWGSDPLEIGWTFWRAGAMSDDVMAAAVQPDPALPIHIAGETFSRAQGWIEGAFESAETVTRRIIDADKTRG